VDDDGGGETNGREEAEPKVEGLPWCVWHFVWFVAWRELREEPLMDRRLLFPTDILSADESFEDNVVSTMVIS